MKKTTRIFFPLVLAVFFGLSPAYAQTGSARAPIDVNLIIDGSLDLAGVKDEIITWVSGRLNEILVSGDRVTVWNAGPSARVIYSGRIDSSAERDAIIQSIRGITPSGSAADFTGALRQAGAAQQSGMFSYTMLIKASAAALSGSEAELLRISRITEISDWRVIVVGLNLDARVRRAASAFISAR